MLSDISTLTLSPITLTVLTPEDLKVLAPLVLDKRIWEHYPQACEDPKVFEQQWFNKAIKQLNQDKRLPFLIKQNHQPVGSTSFYQMDPENKRINIGYTWFHPDYWGTHINALCKFAMLQYCFETIGINRVEFCVDSLNQRSIQALKKLGFIFEGILRNHMLRPDNTLRHSSILSVIKEDWPHTKNFLEEKIGQPCNLILS